MNTVKQTAQLLILILLSVVGLYSQVNPPQPLTFVVAAPSNPCNTGQALRWDYVNTKLWGCVGTTWTDITGGGTGAVSSVFTRTGAVVAASNDYAFSQISGSVDAAQLPNPSSSTLGGVQSKAAVSNQWINAISTSGVPSSTQPACGNLSNAAASCSTDTTVATNISSGTLNASRLPATAALTSGTLSQFAATSSAELATLLSDETGSGLATFATSPTLTTPVITTSSTTTRSVGVTSADGLVLQNTTAAAAGAQQWSPRLHLIGQGWKTTATAASQTLDWIAEAQPVQSTTVPINEFIISAQTNSLGYVPMLMMINPDGTGSSSDAPTIFVKSSGNRGVWSGSSGAFIAGVNPGTTGSADGGTVLKGLGVQTRSVGQYIFSSGTDPSSTADLALDRDAAGVVGVTNGTQGTTAGNYRDLKLRHYISGGTAPTIASGFGTSPSIAGADGAGRLTVGSGGIATTGVITFGTAYATAPACTANDETTILLVQALASTTTLTLISLAVWTAADKLTWICTGY